MTRSLSSTGWRRAADRREVIEQVSPQLILCSAAARAVQTLQALGPLPGQAVVEERLYTAGPSEWLLRMAEVGTEISRLMIIGHLPSIEQLAQGLIAGTHPELMFDPASLAILDVASDWSTLAPGQAHLLDFVA